MLNPADRGIRGNSHMIMQDKNNLQIADLILQWIDERVGKRVRGTSDRRQHEHLQKVVVFTGASSGPVRRRRRYRRPSATVICAAAPAPSDRRRRTNFTGVVRVEDSSMPVEPLRHAARRVRHVRAGRPHRLALASPRA